MRARFVSIALVVTVAVGATMLYAVPVSAHDDEHPVRIDGQLDDLVAEGIITEEQATQIREHLAQRRAEFEERSSERRAERKTRAAALADTLGLSVDELHEALRSGSTIAELAESAGVDLQVVIDQLMAPAVEKVEQAVAEDRITPAEAEERLARLTERITAFVNGEKPERGRPGPGREFGPRGNGGDGGS